MFQSGSATDYLDLLTKLDEVMTGNHLSVATVAAGGTGYTVGDIVTLAGGTSTFAATAEVLTAPAGVVATVRIRNGGAYTVNPSSPASTTGGTGSGLTLNVTFAATGWTRVHNATPSGEREVIWEGVGSGSDLIYVGVKTFQLTAQNGTDTARNWGCVAMTGFNGSLGFHEQAGISPGFDSSGVASTLGGAFLPLKPSDAFPILFWFNVNASRVIVVARVESALRRHYVHAYMGFHNRYGTSAEQPYPIFVAASSARRNTFYLDTEPRITGLTEAIGISGLVGPAFWRTADSQWFEAKNSVATDTASPSRSQSALYTTYPCGAATIEGATEDLIVGTGSAIAWTDIAPNTGIPGTPTLRLRRTPMTGGDLFLLVPATVVLSEDDNGRNDIGVLGEIDDVFWFDNDSTVANEDTLTQDDRVYRVFQNGNRNTTYSFMALREV